MTPLTSVHWRRPASLPVRPAPRPTRTRCRRAMGLMLGWMLVFAGAASVFGDILLPAWLQANMVLPESGQEFAVWGWSSFQRGRVEFQGHQVNWSNRRRDRVAGEDLFQWQARIPRATNSNGGNLRLEAVEGGGRGRNENGQSLLLTNVSVGEVWLWLTPEPGGTPTASYLLSPEDTDRVRRRCRLLRVSRVTDLLAPRRAENPPFWSPLEPRSVPLALSLFAARRTEADLRLAVGFLLLPATEFASEDLASAPTHTPGPPDLHRFTVERQLEGSARRASDEVRAAEWRRRDAVSRLKLEGLVTNAPPLMTEGIEVSRLRFATPRGLGALQVTGVIW